MVSNQNARQLNEWAASSIGSHLHDATRKQAAYGEWPRGRFHTRVERATLRWPIADAIGPAGMQAVGEAMGAQFMRIYGLKYRKSG
jgi:hypothetical protein